MLDHASLAARCHVVSLPMATRFRGIEVREAMLIEGETRWTEWSPFVEYDDAEAAGWLRAALEFGFDRRFAIAEEAEVPVNATVPAVAAEEVPAILERFGRCRAVKVKVAERGQRLDDDVARVDAVRRAVGRAVAVRVDANGGWGVDEAVEALRALAPFELDYAEQPVPDVDGLVEVRRRMAGRIAIAADESVRRATDPLRVARRGAADRIIVKAQPLGGVERAAAIVGACGLPATVSSALETSVGLAMGAQLALRIGAEHAIAPAGLGTASLFRDDVAVEPRRPHGGVIAAGAIEPDPAALERLAVSGERRAWWLDRLARCLDLAGAQAA